MKPFEEEGYPQVPVLGDLNALNSAVVKLEGYMAKEVARRSSSNGRLEEALATLINNQAQFVGQVARMEENYARIKEELSEIKDILRDHARLLAHHQQTLEGLPEAIRQKIGFMTPRS